ncbi:MAG: cation:proton antiporter, partial [Longicatena sp.]
MNLLIIRLLLSILLAFFVGKLVSKVKLPAILGWLLTGMMVGPHALSIINTDLLQTSWYETLIHILECSVGLLIGTELVWKRIRVMGKQIIITTLTQSLGTFFFVSLVFAIVFYFTNIPLYLALIFGGIALATAPAPALSVVREFKTDGPVTKTLIPMAALDDMVGVIVFFSVISVVSA